MEKEIKEILYELNDMFQLSELEQQVKDIEKILDYITNLQDYKSRNEKAIEYIKEHQRKDEFLNLNEWQTRDLLNILNGGENND